MSNTKELSLLENSAILSVMGKKYARYFLLMSLILFIATLVFAVYRSGVVVCPDALTYGRWADDLIARQFDIIGFLKSFPVHYQMPFRIGFISVVATIKQIAGAKWMLGIVLFNLILISVFLVLTLKLVCQLTTSFVAQAFTIFLIFVSADIRLWLNYPISDVTFTTVCVVSAFCFIKAFSFQKINWVYFGGMLISMIALVTLRPTAVPILLAFFGAAVWKTGSQLSQGSKTWDRVSFSTILVLGIVTALFYVFLLNSFDKGKIDLQMGGFPVMYRFFKQGNVIDDRLYTYHQVPQTYWDFLRILADRVLMFFAVTVKDYSLLHNAMNILFFVPSYLFCSYAFYSFLKNKRQHPAITAVVVCCILIIVTTVYHSFTLIDYDWRYRFPLIPFFIILSAIGLDQWVTKVE